VLFEQPERGGAINHLGVEVESTDLVGQAQGRLAGEGLATSTEEGMACCYTRTRWVDGPSGEPWEIYTVLEEQSSSQYEPREHQARTQATGGLSRLRRSSSRQPRARVPDNSSAYLVSSTRRSSTRS